MKSIYDRDANRIHFVVFISLSLIRLTLWVWLFKWKCQYESAMNTKKSSQEFHSFIPRWVEKKSSSGESSWKYAHTHTNWIKSNWCSLTLAKKGSFFLVYGSAAGRASMCVVVPCSLSIESQQTIFAEHSNDLILSANTSTECGWRQGQSKRVVFIWFSNK